MRTLPNSTWTDLQHAAGTLRHAVDTRAKGGFMPLNGNKKLQDYVAPVTAHVVAAEYFKLNIINQVRNLSAYARQLATLKYFMGTLRVRGPPCGHKDVVYK